MVTTWCLFGSASYPRKKMTNTRESQNDWKYRNSSLACEWNETKNQHHLLCFLWQIELIMRAQLVRKIRRNWKTFPNRKCRPNLQWPHPHSWINNKQPSKFNQKYRIIWVFFQSLIENRKKIISRPLTETPWNNENPKKKHIKKTSENHSISHDEFIASALCRHWSNHHTSY